MLYAGRRSFGLGSALALALIGCATSEPGAEETGEWLGRVDTTEAGVVVVVNEGGGAWSTDTVLAVLEHAIGEQDGPAEYLFGDITGIAVDAERNIYVSDQIGSLVQAYGPDGSHLALVGRQGDGPGEFQFPLAPAVGPNGSLWVRDRESRVNRFVARDSDDLLVSFADSWRGPVYPQSDKPTRFDPEGRLYYPEEWGTIDLRRYFYLVYETDGEFVDTLWVPEYSNAPPSTAWYQTSERGGRMVAGLNRPPFSAEPSWDVTPAGNLVCGDGKEYTLTELNLEGDTLRRVMRAAAVLTIPEGERRDSAAALQLRKDTLPVPMSQMHGVPDDVREGRLPETLPAFLAIHSAGDGKIWVERWPLADRRDETFFDVFSADGIFLGTVVVPVALLSEPAPHIEHDAIYGVIRDEETGVERVVKYTFESPSRSQ
jgi:hypothetical protein